MKFDDEFKEEVQQAMSTKVGTWLFSTDAQVVAATFEMQSGVVLAPEPLIVLDLYTVEKSEDMTIQEPVRHRFFLSQDSLTNLGMQIAEAQMVMLDPGETDAGFQWDYEKGSEGPTDSDQPTSEDGKP